MLTVQDPIQMNLCAAVWSVVSYVIADMEEKLPVWIERNEEKRCLFFSVDQKYSYAYRPTAGMKVNISAGWIS